MEQMVFVPEVAYEKAREGILKTSDYIRIAAEAVQYQTDRGTREKSGAHFHV